MKLIYKKNLENKLFKQVDKAEVISFDIFDTLLFRPFAHPFDVFEYLEYFFEIPGFKDARLRAETLARENFSEKGEITIKDIYQFLPDAFQFLEKTEQDFELNILQANLKMLDVFNYAKQKGKKIIITSDMYLPKKLLEKILIKNGFSGIDKIFISSDIGHRKSDGSLFKYIKEYLGIPTNRILHIGDNIVSDYQVPKKLGFKAFHYPNIAIAFFHQKSNLKFKKLYQEEGKYHALFSLFIGMQIIKYHNSPLNSYWENLGYALGGIFIYAYVKFIVDHIKDKSASDCLFIARDGFMLSKIFDLFPETKFIKNHYIYAPRFVRILGLQEGLGQDNYFQFFKESILTRFPQYKALLNEKENLEELFRNKDIKEYCLSVLKEYKNYLKTIPIQGNKIYMVDLGSSSASSQKLLATLLPNKIKAGFYLKLNKQVSIPAFVYDDSSLALKFEELIEFLITSPDMPVIGFNNGKPILKKADENDIENMARITLLQKGELAFCQDIKSILGIFEKEIDADVIKKYMNLFFEYGMGTDLKYLEQIFWFYTPDHKTCVSYDKIFKIKYKIKEKSKWKFLSLLKKGK